MSLSMPGVHVHVHVLVHVHCFIHVRAVSASMSASVTMSVTLSVSIYVTMSESKTFRHAKKDLIITLNKKSENKRLHFLYRHTGNYYQTIQTN
jgi:hypothetical protein